MYDVPLTKPASEYGLEPVVESSTIDVSSSANSIRVTVPPPSLTGALNATLAWESPGVTPVIMGALGGVTEGLGDVDLGSRGQGDGVAGRDLDGIAIAAE